MTAKAAKKSRAKAPTSNGVTGDRIRAPLGALAWVERDSLKPNDYNPNTVLEHNLELLTKSILNNGWTLPIVIRPDKTIIDGFHRWTVAGRDPIRSLLGGMVPVVVVDHGQDPTQNMVGTVTHNRARGVHLLEPMKAIVQQLLDAGKTAEEIGSDLGMQVEEVYRLSGMTRDDFLKLMHQGTTEHSKAKLERVL